MERCLILLSAVPLRWAAGQQASSADTTTTSGGPTRYQQPLVGACRGPGGPHDQVNSRYRNSATHEMCEHACDVEARCLVSLAHESRPALFHDWSAAH